MTYGQLTTPFVPTGAGTTLETTFLYTPNGADQQLLDPGISAFDLSTDASDVLSFNLLANVEIDGVPATSGVTALTEGYHTITGDVDAAADIEIIAAASTLQTYPPGYRFYRLNIATNNGHTHTQLQEVELATSVSGTDVTDPSNPAFAKTTFSANHEPEFAIGNTFTGGSGTAWATDEFFANDTWWYVDTENFQEVVELRIRPIDNASYYNLASPNTFDWEGSVDGYNWDVLESYSGLNDWVQGLSKVFSTSNTTPEVIVPNTPYRHYRINILANHGDTQYTIIQEIELAESVGGPDITNPTMVATDGGNDLGGVGQNIITNTFETDRWISGQFSPNGWVAVDTEASRIIKELRMWYWFNAANVNQSPKSFNLEGSDDGIDWKIIKSWIDEPIWSGGEQRNYPINIGDFFGTQMHTLTLTDPLDGGNSIFIDASVRSVDMPNDPNITDPTGATKYGDWIDLHPTQPYVPLLRGGETPGRTYTPDKYEAYNGDNTTGNFALGVNTPDAQITSMQSHGKEGSWLGVIGDIGHILVGNAGAVIKITGVPTDQIYNYAVLLGTDQAILNNLSYPNIYRVLRNVGGVDNSDEYYYYDQGGLYPWPG